jgi:hypothetical protein
MPQVLVNEHAAPGNFPHAVGRVQALSVPILRWLVAV